MSPTDEIEFQRTNLALGRPVEHEKLFEVIEALEEEIDSLEDAIQFGDASYEAKEAVRKAKVNENKLRLAIEPFIREVVWFAKEIGRPAMSKAKRIKLSDSLKESLERLKKEMSLPSEE